MNEKVGVVYSRKCLRIRWPPPLPRRKRRGWWEHLPPALILPKIFQIDSGSCKISATSLSRPLCDIVRRAFPHCKQLFRHACQAHLLCVPWFENRYWKSVCPSVSLSYRCRVCVFPRRISQKPLCHRSSSSNDAHWRLSTTKWRKHSVAKVVVVVAV